MNTEDTIEAGGQRWRFKENTGDKETDTSSLKEIAEMLRKYNTVRRLGEFNTYVIHWSRKSTSSEARGK